MNQMEIAPNECFKAWKLCGKISLSIIFLQTSSRAKAVKKLRTQNILCVTEFTRRLDILSACSNAGLPGCPISRSMLSFVYRYSSRYSWLNMLDESTDDILASVLTPWMTQIALNERDSKLGNRELSCSRNICLCLRSAAVCCELDEIVMMFGISFRSRDTNSTRAAMLF